MSSASSKAGKGSSPGAAARLRDAASRVAKTEAARVALVVAARLAADAYAIFAAHFRAVSDDDYARVVIAETFAHAPRLDPSGTSWLPAPFWVTGAAMMVFGRSLEVARGVAVVLGIVASLLLYAGAKRVLGDAGRAAWATALATWVPWSVYLGVATVPELPAAALGLYGLSTLVPDRRALDEPSEVRGALDPRWLGAAAIALACCCRYELWPLAAGFSWLTLKDALASRGRARAGLVASAVLVLVGAGAWVAWNRVAHGDAFHFAARVASFARATHGSTRPAEALVYVRALLLDDPGLTVAVAGALAWAALRGGPAGDELRRWARPAGLVAFQVVLLVVAGLRDAAPTHHPERAVLLAVLLAVTAAAGVGWLLATSSVTDRRIALALAVVPWIVAVLAPPRAFAARGDEELVGAAARRESVPGEKVLIEVDDYGHEATVAGLGRPEDVELDRTVDPREPSRPSSFADVGALRVRVAAAAPDLVIARADSAAPAVLGAPLARAGSWALWRVRPDRP